MAAHFRLPISGRPESPHGRPGSTHTQNEISRTRENRARARVRCHAMHYRRCPLWVKSGHRSASVRCLLYPRKRTWFSTIEMSALCQKETFAQHGSSYTGGPPITADAEDRDGRHSRILDRQSGRGWNQRRARDGKLSDYGLSRGHVLDDKLLDCGSILGRAAGHVVVVVIVSEP
jgi:hypothetical protein